MQTKNFSIGQVYTFTINALLTWHIISKFLLLHLLSWVAGAIPSFMLAFFTIGMRVNYVFNPQAIFEAYVHQAKTSGSYLIPAAAMIALLLVYLAISFFVSFCSLKMSLDVYDTSNADLTAAAITTKRLFFKLLGLGFLVTLGFLAGFLFLFIPGIIFLVASMFSFYILIDRNNSIMNALRASWVLTKGIRLKLFGFLMLLAIVIGIPLGLLSIIFRSFMLVQFIVSVARFFIMPVTGNLAFAFVYRSLQKTSVAHD